MQFSVESCESTMKSGVTTDTDIRQKTRVVVSSKVTCRLGVGLRRLSQPKQLQVVFKVFGNARSLIFHIYCDNDYGKKCRFLCWGWVEV